MYIYLQLTYTDTNKQVCDICYQISSESVNHLHNEAFIPSPNLPTCHVIYYFFIEIPNSILKIFISLLKFCFFSQGFRLNTGRIFWIPSEHDLFTTFALSIELVRPQIVPEKFDHSLANNVRPNMRKLADTF